MSRSIDDLSYDEKQAIAQEIIDRRHRHDKQWLELVREYNLDCSPDNLRKLGCGIKFAYDVGMRFDKDAKENMDKNYVERQKLYDMRKQIRKDMREMSRTELICENIDRAINSLPKIKLFPVTPKSQRSSKKDLVVGIGDFHYGAEFNVTGLYGETINKYNSSVFEDRMEQLANEIAGIAEKDNPDQITIMIVGDMLDGMLRASQLQRLEYGVIESTIHLSETLTSWLVALANTVEIPIRVYAVRGNHGEIRPLGTKAGQFPEENMERIVMHYLFARFAGQKNVRIMNSDAPMTQIVDVCGYQFLLTHGQGNNIQNIAKDYVNLYKKPIDVFMVGHLHKSQTFNSGIMPESNVFVERVPSLCGIDPYAQSKGYGALPGATVILMEEGYGRKCVYPVILE